MKKRTLLVVLLLSLFALMDSYSDTDRGYFNVLYSHEFNENGVNNFGLGTEACLDGMTHIIGIENKFANNNNKINVYYIFAPTVFPLISIGLLLNGCLLGIGTNFSYNIDKNIFGIGPQINSMSFIILDIFKIDVTYRYNIYFKAANSHELEFKLGIQFYRRPILF